MKKLSILCVVFLIFALNLSAKSSAAFLRYGVGAKAAGLGRAYQSVVKDPGALYWNPAGLAKINGEKKTSDKLEEEKDEDPFAEDTPLEILNSENGNQPEKPPAEMPVIERQFEFHFYNSVSQLTFDRQAGFSAAAFTALGGTFGAGIMSIYTNDIDGYDAAAQYTGKLTYQTINGYLGYAFEKGSSRAGLSIAGINENIAGKSLNGGTLNAGIQITPFPFLEFGANIQNLAGIMQSSTTETKKFTKLDTILSTSLGLRTLPPKSNLLILLGLEANLDTLEKDDIDLNLGLAYSINHYSYIMGGFNRNGLSGGFGLNLSFFQIAYAVNQDILKTGVQHHIDLNLVF